MADNNYIKFQDFDIKNLRLCEGKINKNHGFQTMEIKYEYPDGKTRGLRLRSPALFSYGVKHYKSKTPDYFMPLLSFYDKENPNEKEIEFKKTLDSISKFLREEAEEKVVKMKKRDNNFEELEIINNNDIFYPKLRQNKTYDKTGKITKLEITTFFKNEEGNLEKVKDPRSLEEVNCKVVAYIDILDIFISSSILKVRTSLSDVAIIKKNVSSKNYENSFTPLSEVTLDSDDEE